MPDNLIDVGGVGIRVEQDGGFIAMDHNHERVHMGQMFYFDHYGTVADGGTLNWLITCGTVYNIHAELGIDVSGAFRFYLYDNSAGSAGTAITLWNMNRDSTVTFGGSVHHTPTISDAGSAIVNGRYIPAGAGVSNRVGGGLRSDTEIIFDAGKKYLALRATFDHSWKLLSAREREVLSCLSIFRGGFDRKAAEEVAGATLGLLASLVSKSLVRRTETGRYDLHEVIRQYSQSHLDENVSHFTEISDYHSAYYLKYVAERDNALKSAAQQAAMRELAYEMDNIRAAWVWAIQRGEFTQLGTSIRSMGWMYEVAGLLDEGIEQLEQLIGALKSGAHKDSFNKELGEALVHQALLYFRKGQFLR